MAFAALMVAVRAFGKPEMQVLRAAPVGGALNELQLEFHTKLQTRY